MIKLLAVELANSVYGCIRRGVVALTLTLERPGGVIPIAKTSTVLAVYSYEGWNFNSGNYLFTTDTK